MLTKHRKYKVVSKEMLSIILPDIFHFDYKGFREV